MLCYEHSLIINGLLFIELVKLKMEEGNQRDKRTGEEAGIVTSENEPKPKRSHRAIQCISEKDVGITAYFLIVDFEL